MSIYGSVPPRPWEALLDYGTSQIVGTGEQRELVIADSMDEAVAEYIVRCVNAHDELIDAIRDLLSGWRYIRMRYGDLYGVGWDRADIKATAVLAKVTEEASHD